MRRRIAITAVVIGTVGALVAAGLATVTYNGCSSWTPFGCHGTDPELTRLIH